MPEFKPDFQRYLAAKKPVDDRALNRHVWETVLDHARPGMRVFEAGCGTGTMLERLEEWEFPHGLSYLGIDSDEMNIVRARSGLVSSGRVPPFASTAFEQADLFDYQPSNGQFDLVIAHAVLDILDVPAALERLFGFLKPRGLFWFTINFDGGTIFEPAHREDDPIIGAYHRSMDARQDGDSRAGRHLFRHIREAGGTILASGASDWVVYPPYPGDEAYFLQHILYFFESTLAGEAGLEEWLSARKEQITAGELVYIAHQVDFAGRV